MTKSNKEGLVLTTEEAYMLQLLFQTKKPVFGLEIIANSHGQLKRGTAYVLLQRMTYKGLVSSQTKAREKNDHGIPRRYYQITLAGKKVHCVWIQLQVALEEALESRK